MVFGLKMGREGNGQSDAIIENGSLTPVYLIDPSTTGVPHSTRFSTMVNT
jgi:hypothetical protein